MATETSLKSCTLLKPCNMQHSHPFSVYLKGVRNTFLFQYFSIFFQTKNKTVLARGRCPPDPPVFGWGSKAPPAPPLNDRPQHLIEAAKRGRLAQMLFFFGAADDTDAADDTARRH